MEESRLIATTPSYRDHRHRRPNHKAWTHDRRHEIDAPRIRTRATHGTGCTLSSAIAANLAKGRSLEDSVVESIAYLRKGLLRGSFPGRGFGIPDHFPGRGPRSS